MGIVRRAQGATTKAIPVWIVEEEQRRDRPQDPCALRVAAARRCAPTSPAPPRLAYGPPALATRPFVLSPRTASIRSVPNAGERRSEPDPPARADRRSTQINLVHLFLLALCSFREHRRMCARQLEPAQVISSCLASLSKP